MVLIKIDNILEVWIQDLDEMLEGTLLLACIQNNKGAFILLFSSLEKQITTNYNIYWKQEFITR